MASLSVTLSEVIYKHCALFSYPPTPRPPFSSLQRYNISQALCFSTSGGAINAIYELDFKVANSISHIFLLIERLIYRYVMSSCIKFDNEVLCYFSSSLINFFMGGKGLVGWVDLVDNGRNNGYHLCCFSDS